MATSPFGVEHPIAKVDDGYNVNYSMRTQGVRFRDAKAMKEVSREARRNSRAVLPGPYRAENARREAVSTAVGGAVGAGVGAGISRATRNPIPVGATVGGILGLAEGNFIGTMKNQSKARKRAYDSALKSGKIVRDDPKNISYWTGLRKDAFGVEKAYTSKEKARIAAGAGTGAVLSGMYLGSPMYLGARVGGMAAGVKATKMYRDHKNATSAKSKWDGNPNYERWKKAQNLADNAGTPGEKQAAQDAADRMKAKHGFEQPKVKPLGFKYKALRRVARLSNPRTAAVVGFGTAAAAGAGVGTNVQRNVIRNEQAARARRKKAA